MKKTKFLKMLTKSSLFMILGIALVLFIFFYFNRRGGIDYPHVLEKFNYSEDEIENLITSTKDYLVWVKKEAHELELYQAGKMIKKYKVNVRAETQDRQYENDGQTPEGVFRVYQCAVISSPPWTRWIAFNTAAKAKKIYLDEYNNGDLILSQYEKKYGIIKNDADIRKFNRKNKTKPMLRGFGIHGGGYRRFNDWTLGCPAMEDADVIELYNFIIQNPNRGLGTYIIITDV